MSYLPVFKVIRIDDYIDERNAFAIQPVDFVDESIKDAVNRFSGLKNEWTLSRKTEQEFSNDDIIVQTTAGAFKDHWPAIDLDGTSFLANDEEEKQNN